MILLALYQALFHGKLAKIGILGLLPANKQSSSGTYVFLKSLIRELRKLNLSQISMPFSQTVSGFFLEKFCSKACQ